MNTSDRAGDFPAPPVAGSKLLMPIRSWEEMHRETQEVGVEFDGFWLDSVQEGVAYFFRWLGKPRATVLVIWQGDRVTHVECRKVGDLEVTDSEMAPVNAELSRIFASTVFSRGVRGNEH